MKSKFQLISLNLLITIISIYFTFVVYEEYKSSVNIKIAKYIQRSIESNKELLKNAFNDIKEKIDSDRRLFLEIHTRYTKRLRENKNLDIRALKKEIKSEYKLQKQDVDLFLLDTNYTIYDATYAKDIGFNLMSVADARLELDKADDGKIHQSPTVSIDIINSEIKSYSYAKIASGYYFEMGFINLEIKNRLQNTMQTVRLLSSEKSNLYRIEKQLDGSEYYENILRNTTHMSKEKYIASKEKFGAKAEIHNPVILANRTSKIELRRFPDANVYYIPLMKKNNEYLNLMGDFVLELYVDKHYENKLREKINIYFFLFLVFHTLFLILIFYFTKKYHEAQLALEFEEKITKKLLGENRSFIVNMVKQIESPLEIITKSFSSIKEKLEGRHTKEMQQIKSAFHMLQNAHDDLNYIVCNEKHEYKALKINLSSFLQERVEFFDDVAQSHDKSIILESHSNIYVWMNDIELERLIDNNISNAIKYGVHRSTIRITLQTYGKKIILNFFSYGEEIKNKEKIFYRNYQESSNAKKSLGLGLSMVRSICEKYDISYSLFYSDKQNNFSYKLQKFENKE